MHKLLTLLTLPLIAMCDTALAASASVPMKYEAAESASEKRILLALKMVPRECQVEIADFSDNRHNKKTISNFFGKSLIGDGVDAWLGAAKSEYLNDIKTEYSNLVLEAKPKLHRLYAYPESMNINGVVAIEIDYFVNGEFHESKHYRGFYGKTNWANGNGEYVTALNLALNHSMVKITEDLGKVCRSVLPS